MCLRFTAVDKSYDMRMVKALEYLDFAVEVFLELLVELREVDGLDGYECSAALQTKQSVP